MTDEDRTAQGNEDPAGDGGLKKTETIVQR